MKSEYQWDARQYKIGYDIHFPPPMIFLMVMIREDDSRVYSYATACSPGDIVLGCFASMDDAKLALDWTWRDKLDPWDICDAQSWRQIVLQSVDALVDELDLRAVFKAVNPNY